MDQEPAHRRRAAPHRRWNDWPFARVGVKAWVAAALLCTLLGCDGDRAIEPTPRTVYMNRWGGDYFPGDEDSRTNHSMLLDEPLTIEAAGVDEATWQQSVAEVSEIFASFQVDVVDTDPGAPPHFEVVVTPEPTGFPFADSVGGAAPAAAHCGALESPIVFVFHERVGSGRIAWTAAHEIGHTLGLEHAYVCSDPMSYSHVEACGDLRFRDAYAACGTDTPTQCVCSAHGQNSVRKLLRHIPAKEGIEFPLRDIGDPCARNQDCGSERCVLWNPGRELSCSQGCEPALSMCPEGTTCRFMEGVGLHFCLPDLSPETGCSIGSTRTTTSAPLPLLLLLLAGMLWRSASRVLS